MWMRPYDRWPCGVRVPGGASRATALSIVCRKHNVIVRNCWRAARSERWGLHRVSRTLAGRRRSRRLRCAPRSRDIHCESRDVVLDARLGRVQWRADLSPGAP